MSYQLISPTIVYANTALVAVFLVINGVTFFRNKGSNKIYKFVLAQAGIETLILDYIAVSVVQSAMGNETVNVDFFSRMWCAILLFFVLERVGSAAKRFSDHALGAVEEQNEKQQEMYKGIVGVTRNVHDNATESVNVIDELVHATESVAFNMLEIAEATILTARSIEEQNSMTQDIQQAIMDTGERSKQMVDIAVASNESIQGNIQAMEELKTQSVLIANTNQEVTDSMSRLQEKTKEVAEQTRTSTEQITRIVNELNENADEVMSSVQNSLEATESQNQKIEGSSEDLKQYL